MFISSRFFRSMRYQLNSGSTSSILNTLIKPIFAGRCRPLTVLLHRPCMPLMLGAHTKQRNHHHGNGDKRTPTSSKSRGKKRGGGTQKASSRGGKRVCGSGRDGDGKLLGGNSSGYRTLSPTAIQVYADPTLSRTVRQHSELLLCVQGQLKNLKEDVEDCTLRLAKQGQAQRSLEEVVKSTSARIIEAAQGQDVLEKNLIYFAKMVANNDNNIRDCVQWLDKCEQRLEESLCMQNYTESTVFHIHSLVMEDVDMVKQENKALENEIRNIREALQREGIVIHISPPPPLPSPNDSDQASKHDVEPIKKD